MEMYEPVTPDFGGGPWLRFFSPRQITILFLPAWPVHALRSCANATYKHVRLALHKHILDSNHHASMVSVLLDATDIPICGQDALWTTLRNVAMADVAKVARNDLSVNPEEIGL